MSKYLGDFATGDTIDFKFTTFRPSTGAAYTLAGSPQVSIYKDNNTAETTTGVTLTVDFDSRTGLNHVRVVTSDGFYATSTQYEAVITSGTVDSVSVVGACVGRFTIQAQTHKAVSGSVGSVTGSVGSVTSAVTVGTNNDKTGYSLATAPPTAADIADAVWDEPFAGHTGSTTYGGRIPRSDSSNVEVKLTGAAHIAADVHEFQPDVLTADAIDATAITEIAQGVLTEATSTSTYAAGDVGNLLARLHNMIEADGANFRYTTNALEQAPSGGGGGGTWELNAEQTTGLKRMISAIVGVGGETATPGVLEFDMIGETTTLRITQSTDGNDRLTVEEI